MNVKNAKTLPQRYFGLHMTEGVAEYREKGKETYRIFVGETTIKNMDPTFEGRPVYVSHVDEVNLENIQNEADGWVVKSFFNPVDGKHWVEFLVVSDEGHQAIRNGWKLSNAYLIKDSRGGGQWHGVDYIKEVSRGEYEHLAIVPNPRYAESVILTPDQFKEYNSKKEMDLKRLANSKKGEGMLNLFKRQKVDNSADLESTLVTLPKTQKEVTILQVVNEYDALMDSMSKPYMCNGEERVKVGDKEMSVNELVAKHLEMTADKDPMHENEETEEEKKKKAAMEVEEKAAAEKKANEEKEAKDKADKEAAEKKANEEKEAAEKKANADKLLNAEREAALKTQPALDLDMDKVARGKARYGSN